MAKNAAKKDKAIKLWVSGKDTKRTSRERYFWKIVKIQMMRRTHVPKIVKIVGTIWWPLPRRLPAGTSKKVQMEVRETIIIHRKEATCITSASLVKSMET